jgi:hypothetical protein
MTYPTRYEGQLTIEPPLKAMEVLALTAFFRSRRIRTTGGPLDCRALNMGHPEVVSYNDPPEGQPSLHCDLEVSIPGDVMRWDRSEDTGPDLDKWITYVIDHLLKEGAEFSKDFSEVPVTNKLRDFTFDHSVNGHMVATATETGEVWKIMVKDNKVFVEDVRLITAVGAEDNEDDDEDE